MKILLVEDNEDDARLLRLRLTEVAGAAVEIVWAHRLADALARLSAEPFDAVLIDLGLPDSEGLDTYVQVARHAPQAAIVVMSGLADGDVATKAVQLGAQDYLTKEINPPESVYKSLRYAVERARRQRAEDDLRVANEELRVAREIQQRLLPKQPPKLPGLDIAGATFFAGKLGGDMFDFISLPDDRWGVVIADASGHDLQAALLIVQTRAYLRAFTSLPLDPGEIVTRTNRFLFADTEDSLFVTLFLLLLDPRTSSFLYVSAGHNGYLFDTSDHVRILRSTGLPLGIDENAGFSQTSPTILNPGQILVLVTDGIPEAAAAENSLFGNKRMIDVVHRNRDRSAGEIVAALLQESHEFSGPHNRQDDKTAIVVKCDSQPAAQDR